MIPYAVTDLCRFADTPLEESIPALDGIRKAGKTKYIGLSECSAATLRKANSSKFPTMAAFESYIPLCC